MKLILLISLFCCVASGNIAYDEELRDLAQRTLNEISRRSDSDMTLYEIVSRSIQRRYDSFRTDRTDQVSLRMIALRDDGTPVDCDATVAIPEEIASEYITYYRCKDLDNSQFYKRSEETQCTTQDIKEIKAQALQQVNDNIDQENELQSNGLDMLPMAMPELQFQQGHYEFKDLISCTKAGNDYDLKIHAIQEGQDIEETCNIRLIKDGSKYNVKENQCQGET